MLGIINVILVALGLMYCIVGSACAIANGETLLGTILLAIIVLNMSIVIKSIKDGK